MHEMRSEKEYLLFAVDLHVLTHRMRCKVGGLKVNEHVP